jgi:Lon protease (S16) C-terminal proteolytic domain
MNRVSLSVFAAALLLAFGNCALAVAADASAGDVQLPRRIDRDFEFTNTSRPYVLNGNYEVIKEAQPLKITVGPGVEVRGGDIYLEDKGELILNGTPEKPVILREVTLSQQIAKHPTTAKWTLFDRCQFEKRGGWYSYYSAKWTCDSRLFYRCTFPYLKGTAFGFKMSHCAFVKMSLPEIVHRQPKEGPFDHMKYLRHDWNMITGCQFVDCEIAPTVGWCSEESNFMGCSFKRGQAYESESRTEVEAYVADTVGDLPHQVWKGCEPPKSLLQVSYARTPYATFTLFPSLSRSLSSPVPKITEDTKIMSWLASKPVPFCSGVAKQGFAVAQTEKPQKFEERPARKEDVDKDKAKDDKPKPRVAEKADSSSQKDACKFVRMQSSIKGLYILHTGSGLNMGGAQDIIATIEHASHDRETICDFTGEVAKDTQISMEEAERLLKVRYPIWEAGHKIRFSYGDKYAKQSGGSAGGAFSVLLLSLLGGLQIDPAFAMTGDVTVDGKIREIGAAAEKIRGAMLEKCSVVAIPVANKENLNDLAVLYSPAMFWSIQIFSIATLDDAAAVARVDRAANLAKAMETFAQVQRSLPANATAYTLRSPGIYRTIWEVQRLAPNHLSAEFMLRAANNQLPATLSLGGSLEEIWSVAGPLLGFLFADYSEPDKSKRYYMERVPAETFKGAMERLNWLQMRLHPKTRDLRAAMADYMVSLDQLHRAPTFSAVTLRQHLEKRDRVLGEAHKLGVDRKVLEEMMH